MWYVLFMLLFIGRNTGTQTTGRTEIEHQNKASISLNFLAHSKGKQFLIIFIIFSLATHQKA